MGAVPIGFSAPFESLREHAKGLETPFTIIVCNSSFSTSIAASQTYIHSFFFPLGGAISRTIQCILFHPITDTVILNH